MTISYKTMKKQKPLFGYERVRLCPSCDTEITAQHISEEMSSVAICPNRECNLKIYLGGD